MMEHETAMTHVIVAYLDSPARQSYQRVLVGSPPLRFDSMHDARQYTADTLSAVEKVVTTPPPEHATYDATYTARWINSLPAYLASWLEE
jgi:hypothetical protein